MKWYSFEDKKPLPDKMILIEYPNGRLAVMNEYVGFMKGEFLFKSQNGSEIWIHNPEGIYWIEIPERE